MTDTYPEVEMPPLVKGGQGRECRAPGCVVSILIGSIFLIAAAMPAVLLSQRKASMSDPHPSVIKQEEAEESARLQVLLLSQPRTYTEGMERNDLMEALWRKLDGQLDVASLPVSEKRTQAHDWLNSTTIMDLIRATCDELARERIQRNREE